ncbi:hypothetical protein KPZU09_03430 [Klebsiella pneumoniae]|uniref:Uncharacterized protein n=1 Tax=Klebsiella pneumoniae TaxID=573 RepID=A0A919LWP7_KLEPN|nr:hypothetical protein KPZU09_03430 [Klebsiella pneumoniae]
MPIACWRKASLCRPAPAADWLKAAMHGERISVRHIAVPESTVVDWQDHILNLPDRAR